MLLRRTASIRQQVRQRASVLSPMPRAVLTRHVRSSHHRRCECFRNRSCSRGGRRPGVAAAGSNILLPDLSGHLLQCHTAPVLRIVLHPME